MLPMLATPSPHPGRAPEGQGWVHEVKWDGMRVLAERTDGRLRLTSRRGNTVTTAYPELLAESLPDDVLLDGEVVALAGGVPSFLALAGRIHVRDRARAAALAAASPVTFMVFDVLRLYGVDLIKAPWRERRGVLERLDLGGGGSRWQVPPTYADGQLLVEATKAQGLEGIVSKRVEARYWPGRRSPDWLKMAHRTTVTCAVAGWTPQAGMVKTLGALWMAAPDGAGGWRTLGRVGSGLAGALATDLARRLAPLTRPDCPYAELPDDPDTRRTTWVQPTVLIDVRYLGFDESGRLRQPVLRAVRTDLGIEELLAGEAAPAGDGL